MRSRRIDNSIVAAVKNNDEPTAIREALALLSLNDFTKEDDVVVITANMVNDNKPDRGVVVGQESLREVIRFFKNRKVKRIVIAAGSGGGQTKEISDNIGYEKIYKEEGCQFIDLNKGPFTELNLEGNIIKSTKINRLIEEATLMVSFTQLKSHEEATVSGVIKNIALSWPPAEIHGYPKKNLGIHEDLHDFIFRMASSIPIDLSILSLSPAMVGTGPSKGIAKRSNMVLASLDPVSCDTVGADLLGLRPQGVSYLYRLIKAGIGEGNIKNISIKGLKLIDMEKEFSKLAYGFEFSLNEE
ncbi:MAG TPA: DUF362 domain-containing protein [Clostridiaceae bacterium]